MLRFAIVLLAVVAAGGTAEAADQAVARHGWHRTGIMLPAGLPRPHYRYRTTISYAAPYGYRRPVPRLSVYDNPRVLYAPDYADVAYIRPWVGAPLLPGYYGSGYSYDDLGPYYGGPYVGYWDRLPYACGVYGYC
jgi:hypothetical protein